MTEPEVVEVLTGSADPDLSWMIQASGTDDMFFTMLRIERSGEHLGTAGMGGPKLYPGRDLNTYDGQHSGLPYFVMVRTGPHVERVIATTSQGTEVDLALSPVFPEFGLRFGAAALPDGERPGAIRSVPAH